VIDPMRAWTAEMRGRRSRLGNLLALIALCLQLAAPILPAPQVSSAAQNEFAEFLRLHALCLGGDAAQQRPEAPTQDGSDRTRHRIGACCFLHGNASSLLVGPNAVQPVAFRLSEILFPARAITEVAAHPFTTPRARAPPKEV
jgi:Protein of unknown function (DUF2946)